MDEPFVVVSVEEVELSLSEVVALPSSEETVEDAGRVLEARVRATREVANVHELALLERAASARALARALNVEKSDEDGQEEEADLARRRELERALKAAWESVEHYSEGGSPPASTDCEERWESSEAFCDYLEKRGRAATFRRRPPATDEAGAPLSRADSSEAQARKDIERDALVVSTEGKKVAVQRAEAYEAVVAGLAKAARKLVDTADAREWRPVDDADLRLLAKTALRAVNRTESGGLGLETLALVLPPGLAAVPDSKNADPLKIDLSLGPAPDPRLNRGRYSPSSEQEREDTDAADAADADAASSSADKKNDDAESEEENSPPWRWGLRARVAGTTLYRLFPTDGDADLDAEPAALARATYSNFLLLPLDALDDRRPTAESKLNAPVLFDRRQASVLVNVHLNDRDRLD